MQRPCGARSSTGHRQPSQPDSLRARTPRGRRGRSALQTPQRSSAGCSGGGDALCAQDLNWVGKGGKIHPLRVLATSYSPPPSQRLQAEGCLSRPQQQGGGRATRSLVLPSVPKHGSAPAAPTSRSSVNITRAEERSGRLSGVSSLSKHRLRRFFRPFISHVIFSI